MGLGMEEYTVFHFQEKLDRQTFAENIWICGHATFPELFEFVDRFIGQVLSVFSYGKNSFFSKNGKNEKYGQDPPRRIF